MIEHLKKYSKPPSLVTVSPPLSMGFLFVVLVPTVNYSLQILHFLSHQRRLLLTPKLRYCHSAMTQNPRRQTVLLLPASQQAGSRPALCHSARTVPLPAPHLAGTSPSPPALPEE